ncbi:hypothetical protein [Myroides odoratus]|uniref:hypothetical protein n=1 Tax=Myroides odoratus TaxID=256 RepID=UPI0039AEC567
MKKLFMFLAVAGLATFGASCSSSDDNGGGKNPQLALSADKTTVNEGDSVTFTVKADGKAETGAELYIGSEKITNPYKFATKGEYKVVAKKSGATESAAVTINVVEKGVEIKTLVLSVDKTAVTVGGKVKFTVKDNKGASVAGFKIKQVGGADVTGDEWTAQAAGTFKFVASKEDYTGSNEVSVVVTDAPGGNIVLALVTNPADIFAGQGFELSIKDAAGAGITGAVLHVDGNATTILSTAGGVFRIQGPAGTISLTAVFDGKTSNAVSVTVKEAEPVDADMSGTFVYTGTTYNVNEGSLVFMRLQYADATRTTVEALWQIEVETEGAMSALVAFSTPATPAGTGGSYNYEIPTATNTTAKAVAVFNGNNNVGEATAGITFTLNTTPNADRTIYTGTSATSATVTNAPFTMNLNGDFVYFDASEQSANGIRGTRGFKDANNVGKVKATSTRIAKMVK